MRILSASFMLCMASCVVHAEERFYQVIDANGRAQLIREPSVSSKVDAPDVGKEPNPVPAAAVVKNADVVKPAAKAKEEKRDPLLDAYAPYDGEQFLDSETMDAAHEKAGSSSKQRFYVIPDGVGQRVEGMDGDPVMPETVSAVASDDMKFVELRNGHVQRSASDIRGLQSGCLSERHLKDAKLLGAGELGDMIFDERLSNYVHSGEIVELYRLGSPGLSSAIVRSYAKTDTDPGFVLPLLAFADAKGCVSRVSDGYFQRYYPATRYKRSMLEANLVVHSEDAYVLVVMPGAHEKGAGIRPEYRISSTGRVSVKWQR